MTAIEKRLARTNALYLLPPRLERMRHARRSADHPDAPGREADRTAAQRATSIWLRLLKAHGLILREVRHNLRGSITLPQFEVLANLEREPEGLTLVELSRRLLVTAGNLTGLVDRLVRRGLVRRETDPSDRRATRVHLSSSGRALVAALIPRHADLLAGLVGGLPLKEQDQLRRLLGRLGDALAEPSGRGR